MIRCLINPQAANQQFSGRTSLTATFLLLSSHTVSAVYSSFWTAQCRCLANSRRRSFVISAACECAATVANNRLWTTCVFINTIYRLFAQSTKRKNMLTNDWRLQWLLTIAPSTREMKIIQDAQSYRRETALQGALLFWPKAED